MAALTAEQAKAFYDRFGARQDSQAFYERPALEDLTAHAGFGAAQSVVELGCGTGRLAEELLSRHLSPSASYLGLDLSTTMAGLASRRIAGFGSRARVILCGGAPAVPLPGGSCDRFLATYVFDLLSEPVLESAVREAHRVLEPGGLLCLAGITPGATPLSRLVMGVWSGVFSLRPGWVGGCRPIQLGRHLSAELWSLRHHRTVVAYGIASEILVAAKRSAGPGAPLREPPTG